MFQPSRLAVFVIDKQTGAPVAGLPFYAEVVSPAPVEPDPRFVEAIRAVLSHDPTVFNDAAAVARVQASVARVMSRVLPGHVRDKLRADHQRSVQFLRDALEEARQALGDVSLADATGERLDRAVETGVERTAKAAGFDHAGFEIRNRAGSAYPIGTLATDHAGYLSFDLARLPGNVREGLWAAVDGLRVDPAHKSTVVVWLHVMGREETRFNALQQMRFAEDVVLTRIELVGPIDVPQIFRTAGFAAMQAPSLTDWRLSPASFAATPHGLLGSDGGCENLLPSNLAVSEYSFYQVIGLTDMQDVVPDLLRSTTSLGWIQEFRIAWYPLGHSLGQILYSMPLAPGESVNLAVVDWTRRDDAQRKEVTKLDEQLVHDEHRERVIGETVAASLQELQQGSSLVGGVAASAGATAGLSSVNLAGGVAGSIGGSTATSEGSRKLAGDTVQTVADRITQASAAQRELKSTVVVHSSEAEKEAIETRTVVNYNHSHALTILYYEVLRHFRVLTEIARRRPAVLKKVRTDWFSGGEAAVSEAILRFRESLQGALLNPALAPAFDAVDRIDQRLKHDALFPPGAPPPPLPMIKRGPAFRFFDITMTTGGISVDANEEFNVSATLFPKNVSLNGGGRLDPPGSFRMKDFGYSFVGSPPNGATILWGEIHAIRFKLTRIGGGAIVSFKRITVNALDDDGGVTLLLDRNYEALGGQLILDNDWDLWLPTHIAPAPPAPPLRPAPDIQDDVDRARLVAHLRSNALHYSCAILLNMSPTERFAELGPLAEHVENRVVEFVGESAAYPCTDPRWMARLEERERRISTIEPDERLVALPTRGVFAEAKLGHCNASEEIDNTRFWDWQTSPIPHMAPEIAPVQPVVPQPQQQNLAPTAFPQSLVNIVNPPAAPDPAGLTAALNVLGTSNIFRDLSGQGEVTDLLKRLSDNSISIAEAANAARRIRNNSTNFDSSGSRSPTNNASSESKSVIRPRPTEPSMAARNIQDNQNALLGGVAKGLLTPDEANDLAKQDAKNQLGLENVAASQGDLDTPDQIWPNRVKREFLPTIATVNFSNASDIDNWFIAKTGKGFINWFNSTHANKGWWGPVLVRQGIAPKLDKKGNRQYREGRRIGGAPSAVLQQRFNNFWDGIPVIFNPAGQISLIQFLCLMSITINEVSGNLASVSENGDLKYMFEPNSSGKGSYNIAPYTAYELFNLKAYNDAHGKKNLADIYQNTMDEKWRHDVWPTGAPTSTSQAAPNYIEEADFYKFRGRGVIQTTLRSAYQDIVSFISGYNGANAVLIGYRNRWQGTADVNTLLTQSSNLDWDTIFEQGEILGKAIYLHSRSKQDYLTLDLDADTLNTMDGEAVGSIYRMGRKISGSVDYGRTFMQRVVQLLNSFGNNSGSETSPPVDVIEI